MVLIGCTPRLSLHTSTGEIRYSSVDQLQVYGHGLEHVVPHKHERRVYSHEEVQRLQQDLLESIGEVLGLPTRGVTFKTKILRNKAELAQAYVGLARRSDRVNAFYMNDENAIYYSADNLHRSLIAHEMTHVLLANYFDKPIPKTINEMIAERVEYEYIVRKNPGTK